MTEFAKPGWLQNAGSVHTAEQLRNYTLALLVAGAQGATSLQPRGGVSPALGNKLAVTQTGSPSMAVLVRSGECVIPGTEGAKQGGYGAGNDADVTLAIAAAHATLARIDIVIFRVRDTFYSGGVDSAVLEVVTGTPAGSPSAPATPANSLLLAQVAVGAAVSSIVNANITDTRIWLTSLGGIVPVASQAQQDALLPLYDGLSIWRTDTDVFSIYNGTAYVTMGSNAAWTSYSPAWTSSGTAPAIGNGTLTGASFKLGRLVFYRVRWVAGSTTTFGTGNYFFSLPFTSISLGSFDLPCSGSGILVDLSTQVRYRVVPTLNTTTVVWLNVGDNNPGVMQATAPATWANGDSLNFSGVYEAAS